MLVFACKRFSQVVVEYNRNHLFSTCLAAFKFHKETDGNRNVISA